MVNVTLMVQVDLDYTFGGGRRKKWEESEGTPDCDLQRVEDTSGGENGRSMRRSTNRKDSPTQTSKFKKEEGYQQVKERRVKVMIIKSKP